MNYAAMKFALEVIARGETTDPQEMARAALATPPISEQPALHPGERFAGDMLGRHLRRIGVPDQRTTEQLEEDVAASGSSEQPAPAEAPGIATVPHAAYGGPFVEVEDTPPCVKCGGWTTRASSPQDPGNKRWLVCTRCDALPVIAPAEAGSAPPDGAASLTEPWTDAKLRGIASDYFTEAKDWPAAMLCMRHLLMEQRAAKHTAENAPAPTEPPQSWQNPNGGHPRFATPQAQSGRAQAPTEPLIDLRKRIEGWSVFEGPLGNRFISRDAVLAAIDETIAGSGEKS